MKLEYPSALEYKVNAPLIEISALYGMEIFLLCIHSKKLQTKDFLTWDVGTYFRPRLSCWRPGLGKRGKSHQPFKGFRMEDSKMQR